MPEYVDPIMKRDHTYGLEEMTIRFKKIEELLKQSIEREQPKVEKNAVAEDLRNGNCMTEDVIQKDSDIVTESMNIAPGLITVRTITYEESSVDIPYFLRDAFLLPQRFEESQRFLIRMGGEQQARLMSELPDSLEGFHERVTRYTETHSETFFDELKEFVAEEIRRRKLIQSRPGELFLFYESSEIVVTRDLGEVAINKENFVRMPGLIDQLNEDGIKKVSELPKELLIIGKYKRVGKSRVKDFFEQLREKQNNK